MRRVLYILKQNDLALIEMIRLQANIVNTEIVLIQDAVSMQPAGLNAFTLAEDTHENSLVPMISYKELILKIFEADAVITW